MAIKSGFFHSIKTGDTYDRSYTAEDHNSYFNGMVVQNGVFHTYKSSFEVSGEVVESDQSITYVDPDTEEEVTKNGYISVFAQAGKALVNGHWVINDSDEPLYLSDRDPALPRLDAICLRWRMDQRDVILCVKEGAPASGIDPTTDKGVPHQYGYLEDALAVLKEKYPNEDQSVLEQMLALNTDLYFDPEDDETYGSVLEIVLAYVYVPPTTKSTEKPKVYSRIGSHRCPYISHLAQPKQAKENADTFVAQYTQAIMDWWEEIQEGGSMKANLTTIRHRITANHASIIYLSGANAEIPGYEYEIEDTVNVYLNGLFLDNGTDYEIRSDQSGAFYIQLLTVGTINEKNILSILIYKGTAISLPDASTIRY